MCFKCEEEILKLSKFSLQSNRRIFAPDVTCITTIFMYILKYLKTVLI